MHTTKEIPEWKPQPETGRFMPIRNLCWAIGIDLALSLTDGGFAMTGRCTEAQHPRAMGLQDLPPDAILSRLLAGQQAASEAVRPALPPLAAPADFAADLATAALRRQAARLRGLANAGGARSPAAARSRMRAQPQAA